MPLSLENDMNSWQNWNSWNSPVVIKKINENEIEFSQQGPVFVLPPGYKPVGVELADDERTVIVKRRPGWGVIGVATVEVKD